MFSAIFMLYFTSRPFLCDCTSYISFPGNLLAIHNWDKIRNHFENLLLELVVSVVLEHVYIDPLIAKSLINDQEFIQKC